MIALTPVILEREIIYSHQDNTNQSTYLIIQYMISTIESKTVVMIPIPGEVERIQLLDRSLTSMNDSCLIRARKFLLDSSDNIETKEGGVSASISNINHARSQADKQVVGPLYDTNINGDVMNMVAYFYPETIYDYAFLVLDEHSNQYTIPLLIQYKTNMVSPSGDPLLFYPSFSNKHDCKLCSGLPEKERIYDADLFLMVGEDSSFPGSKLYLDTFTKIGSRKIKPNLAFYNMNSSFMNRDIYFNMRTKKFSSLIPSRDKQVRQNDTLVVRIT